MSGNSRNLLKTVLRALRCARLDDMAAPFMSNVGVIFMLHHVAPDTGKDFEPNDILRVRPEFLEAVIDEVVDSGFDVISLDDVPERLANIKSGARPFACFTFDDGYRDNRDYAYPIFKRKGLPFAVYVPSEFAEGRGDLWWLALEGAIARASQVSVQMEGELKSFRTETTAEKYTAYNEIYWWLRRIPEDRARFVVSELAKTAGYDAGKLCSDLVMSWDELREFTSDPLVTIGAHTMGHYALGKLSDDNVREEIADSVVEVEKQLGRPCHHFSYPYGSERDAGEREFEIAAKLGLKTAVTTRKGLLHSAHACELTALPRLSLNGDFQDISLVKTLLSGVPFALLDAVKAVTGKRMAG